MGRDESKRDRRFPLLSTRFGFLEICATDSRHYREIQFLWKQFPPLPAAGFTNLIPRQKIREQGARRSSSSSSSSFHTHPLHPRGHVSFYLAPSHSFPLDSSLFSFAASFFLPSFFFSFPSLSLSFSVSLCVVLSSLQHVHRCLKSSGRQADLRYATARVWARARARERSPREGTENEPTRVGERQRENEEDDARTRRDEERAWDWKENATDD